MGLLVVCSTESDVRTTVSPWFVVMRMRGCLVAEVGLLRLVSSVFVEFG